MPPKNHEDSTLFSLDQLTRRGVAATASRQEDDSGLIDLDAIEAQPSDEARGSVRIHPVAVPSPPPLQVQQEESTLNGLAAVSTLKPPKQSLKWLAFALAMSGLSIGLGYVFAKVLPGEQTTAASTPTVIIYAPAAPTPQTVEQDQKRSENAAPVDVLKNVAKPRESDVLETAKLNAPQAPTAARQKAPSQTRQQKASSAKPPSEPKANKPKEKERLKDPCAHCGSDLSCAMRCAVKGSK